MEKGGRFPLSKTFLFYGSCVSFIAGVALSSIDKFIGYFNEYYVFASIMLGIILFNLNFRRSIKIAIFIAIFMFLGIWRFLITFPDIDRSDLSFYNGQKIKIDGVITSDTVRKDNRQNFVMDVLNRGEDKEAVNGKVMVYAHAYPEYFYGDELSLFCELKAPEPFNGFDYGRYLAKDQIYSICYYPAIQFKRDKQGNFLMAGIYALRHRLASVIDEGLSEPESGVARATILGEGKIIDDELRQSFSLSGLSHIIAISGMHITVLAAMICFILFKIGLSRDQVFYFSIIFLVLFIVIAGMPSSGVRSGIMAALAMLALKIGRINNFSRLIIFTAAVQLLCNPRMLRDDIGFQLSFISILGIVYLYPIIDMALEKIGMGNSYKIRDLVSVSLAAQIATGGIIVYNFGTVSVLSLVANILVLWTSGFILIFLFIAIFAGLLFSSILPVLFFPVKMIVDYMYIVSDLVIKIPFSYLKVNVNLHETLAYYSLLVIVIVLFRYKINKKQLKS